VKYVVCLSGGLDSAVLLYDLAARGWTLRAVSVGYGQRHRRELSCARSLAERVGVPFDLVDVRCPILPGALTDGSTPMPFGHYEDASMRDTVVPNRNMLLLSVALSVAAAHSFDGVSIGAHAGDHAISSIAASLVSCTGLSSLTMVT